VCKSGKVLKSNVQPHKQPKLFWPAESDIWLSGREAPKFAKVEPSNAKYRVLHKLWRPSVFLSKSLHLRVTCYPVSFRRDLQALVERQIILQSHARLNPRMPLPRIS